MVGSVTGYYINPILVPPTGISSIRNFDKYLDKFRKDFGDATYEYIKKDTLAEQSLRYTFESNVMITPSGYYADGCLFPRLSNSPYFDMYIDPTIDPLSIVVALVHESNHLKNRFFENPQMSIKTLMEGNDVFKWLLNDEIRAFTEMCVFGERHDYKNTIFEPSINSYKNGELPCFVERIYYMRFREHVDAWRAKSRMTGYDTPFKDYNKVS